MSKHIIYQSNFSRCSYINIFKNKSYSIVNNGCQLLVDSVEQKIPIKKNEAKVLVTFHKGRPMKGTRDVLKYLARFNETDYPIKLKALLLGYDAGVHELTPDGSGFNYDEYIKENSGWIETEGKFLSYTNAVSDKISDCDFYISFARFDPCPNMMIEIMAHGLPTIGCDSGGVPEIIGDSGVLLPVNDECYYPGINRNFDGGVSGPSFEAFYTGVVQMIENHAVYLSSVDYAVNQRLNIASVAKKYEAIAIEVEKK